MQSVIGFFIRQHSVPNKTSTAKRVDKKDFLHLVGVDPKLIGFMDLLAHYLFSRW